MHFKTKFGQINKSRIIMNAKSKGYTLIVVLLCAFALTIYGAYSPARKAQKQQVVCVKFKKGVESAAVEQHMNGFATLKHEIPQIVGYTSGKTILPNQAIADYDVVHYLTFQSEADIKTFENSAAYKQFVKDNQGIWEKTLTVNADIRQ
jgi:hypothetical protein